MGTFVIGVTGASGAPYARTVLSELLRGGHKVFVVISDSGRKVLQVESGVSLTGNTEADIEPVHRWLGLEETQTGLTLLHHQDVAAPIASGSYPIDGMAIVPCSGGVLGRIANGISNGLVERAADVCLKERRRLILVPRETPISLVHLRNMTAVTEMGAQVWTEGIQHFGFTGLGTEDHQVAIEEEGRFDLACFNIAGQSHGKPAEGNGEVVAFIRAGIVHGFSLVVSLLVDWVGAFN